MRAATVLSLVALVGARATGSGALAPNSASARILALNSSALVKGGYPFPCDNPPIEWMCNTTEFCNAANRMKEDGCWFMPAYCEPRCHEDIKTLANTDCIEHPGKSPFLERIAVEVEDQLRCVCLAVLFLVCCFFGGGCRRRVGGGED